MNPFPPLPISDQITMANAHITNLHKQIAFQEQTLCAVNDHLSAGRWNSEQAAWVAAQILAEIKRLQTCVASLDANLARLREAFAAEVAEGAAFDRWAAQRHGEALCAQPAPLADNGGEND